MPSQTKMIIDSIVQFLKRELTNGNLTPESAEGVEVAIQCLENAYGLAEIAHSTQEQPCHSEPRAGPGPSSTSTSASDRPDPCLNLLSAELFKNEGNEHMNNGKYLEAFHAYTKAIGKDPNNAMYYCNRAAALSKMGQHDIAVRDCQTAVSLNPTYSKAYSRLGLAYTQMGDHTSALQSYERAYLLEPTNEYYKTNYDTARSTQDTTPSEASPAPQSSQQSLDLTSIFTNPALLTMASQMLSNPSMQSVMGNILSGNMSSSRSGMDALIQAGQQLAVQMESENPDIVNLLRQRMQVQSQGDNTSTSVNNQEGPNNDSKSENNSK